MSKKSIKYIAFFDAQDSTVKRNYVTSASNKIEYIAKAIASLDKEIEIISMSQVLEPKFKIYLSEKKTISERVTLKLFFSWGGNNIVLKKLRIIWHLISMFLYLLSNCDKSDTVIVYHSLGYYNIIKWAKKIKKFKLVLEVEEIYSDVSAMSPYWRNLEFKMFEIADAFILSNDLLDKIINKKQKPSTVIYGTYQTECKQVEKVDDGKIHVVYAGTFDPNKGGAQIAISAASFLPAKYHIHICGFGSEENIQQIKSQIETVRVEGKATISYDGLKKGNDFIKFLQGCHIGLSTQNPNGQFNDSSFPSKILTYIANGLSVVSIKIPVLERATIANHLFFFETGDGKALSDAILKVQPTESQFILTLLDKNFKRQIKAILDTLDKI